MACHRRSPARILHAPAAGELPACTSELPASASVPSASTLALAASTLPLAASTLALAASTLTLALALALGLALAPSPARASGAMVTDDARLVDGKACQLETWIRDERGRTELWAQPACNVTDNLEIGLGGAIAGTRLDAADTRTSALFAQAKTLFAPLGTQGWGVGLVAGVVREPQAEAHRLGWYAYVPISRVLRDDALFLHANIGWSREPGTRRERPTWALSTEARLAERARLIAEVFGQTAGRPQHQLGLRYEWVPDRLEIDVTYGDRFGGNRDERWFTVGLRLLSAPFLP